jgi:Lrp/AsnC family leucine-responsive transcriptional regulator
MKEVRMDEADKKITHLLHQHGRLTHEQIAHFVHLARPTVHERIKRLESIGVIRGYRARVDWSALGFSLTAFIWVASRSKTDDTAAGLLRLENPEVIIEACHGVTGEWCILLHVHVASPHALKDFIDSIYTIDGVQNTMTILSLTAYHELSATTGSTSRHQST